MNKVINLLLISGSIYSLSAAMAVAKKNVNVRSEPSMKGSIVGVLGTKEYIEIINKVTENNATWYETPRGYIYGKLMHVLKETEEMKPLLKKQRVINVYATPSKSAQVVETLKKAYFNLSDAEDEKFIQGDDFPWYKTDKGWVEGSWIKGVYIPKIKETKKEELIKEKVPVAKKEILPEPKELIKVVEQVKDPMKGKETKVKEKYKYFVGISLHYNTLGVIQKDKVGTIILNEEPDDSASSIGLHIGTKINEFIVSANYEMLNLDDVKVQTTYLALDYQFETLLKPYVGVSLGMSDLAWQIDPLTASATKDAKLSSLMYGIQAGVEYEIVKHWNINAAIAYQKLDFTTELISSPAESELKHTNKTSFGAGVRYWF